MGNKFCKVPFQGVCPTNEGYAKGSLDHGKHKDELCTLYTTLMAIASYAKGSLDHGKHKDELCTLYTTLMAIASRREVVM